ncbi:hypothetical protein JCM1841_003840 [Sporobolomyces salmonicolor]
MRLRRWVTPPPSRPPDRTAPIGGRPPPPSLPPPPAAVPPSILAARRQALRRIVLPAAPREDPYQHLGSILHRLPPISTPPRLRFRSAEELEQEVAIWRRACAAAHAALFGPLRSHAWKFRNSVVRVVGHTMRLLLRMRHVEAAKELDRAFFTMRPVPSKRRYNLGIDEDAEAGGEGISSQRRRRAAAYSLGKGLGLARAGIHIAWMQSLAVRLHEEGNETGIGEFAALLRQMHDERGGTGQLNPHVLAFLARKMELVHERLEKGGKAQEGARKEVRRILKAIKGAETDEQAVVSLALLDGAVERLERAGARALDSDLFFQVERGIEALVGSLDGPVKDGIFLAHELHQMTPRDSASLDRHAHILYLAIRFLLLRARHLTRDPFNSAPSRSTVLFSASQLYALLLDLIPSVSSSPLDLYNLRVRQTSAFYRLLWAHTGVLDPQSPFFRREKLPEPCAESSLPALNFSFISQTLDLIDLTLSALSFLPPPLSSRPSHLPSVDPRLLGISSRFYRHLLYTLSLSSAPSRRSLHLPLPPWSLFQRVFRTISDTRAHDAACSSRRTSSKQAPVHREAFFVQPGFAMHLVRATLLGGGEAERDSVAAAAPNEGAGTPLSRLSELLAWIEDIERTSHKGTAERKARALIKRAAKEVVEQEWRGEGAKEWRAIVLRRVDEWADRRGEES